MASHPTNASTSASVSASAIETKAVAGTGHGGNSTSADSASAAAAATKLQEAWTAAGLSGKPDAAALKHKQLELDELADLIATMRLETGGDSDEHKHIHGPVSPMKPDPEASLTEFKAPPPVPPTTPPPITKVAGAGAGAGGAGGAGGGGPSPSTAASPLSPVLTHWPHLQGKKGVSVNLRLVALEPHQVQHGHGVPPVVVEYPAGTCTTVKGSIGECRVRFNVQEGKVMPRVKWGCCLSEAVRPDHHFIDGKLAPAPFDMPAHDHPDNIPGKKAPQYVKQL